MNPTSLKPLPSFTATPSPTAQLYLAFSRLLDFPSPELRNALSCSDALRELQALYAAAEVRVPELMATFGDILEQAYIATFDINAPESPAPLYETAYDAPDGEDRRTILEELVRFYEYFDLELSERPEEQPDHITVELEFMAVLAQMAAAAAEQHIPPRPFQLAQRDFLARHLVPFVAAIRCRTVPTSIYTMLLDGLSNLLHAEQQRLEACCDTETVHALGKGKTYSIETAAH